MRNIVLIIFVMVLFSCDNSVNSQPDSRLFNAWINVGYKNVAKEYNVTEQYFYTDDQIMHMYNFTKEYFDFYVRGTFHPAVGINYFDSTNVISYTISVDDKTIQGSDINTLDYEIESQDDLLGLILSCTYQGVVNIGGTMQPATIYSESYLVKIDKDSLLADWPPVKIGNQLFKKNNNKNNTPLCLLLLGCQYK